MNIEYNRLYRDKYVMRRNGRRIAQDEYIPIFQKTDAGMVKMVCEKERIIEGISFDDSL